MIKLSTFIQKKKELKPRYERLSFCIDECRGEIVEEANLAIPRQILRSGKSYIYAVSNPAKLIGMNNKILEAAKSKVIEILASGDEEIGIQLLERAKSLAMYELNASGIRESSAIAELIAHDVVGYGPISIIMADLAHIEEIEVNRPDSIIDVYHSKYGRCSTNLRFLGYPEFVLSINRFAYACEKELNDLSPILDAQVGDARLHAQLKPYAISGASATVRLGGSKEMNISSIARNGTTNGDVLAYLWLAMDCGMNMIIAGAPASGKTTMLTSLLSFTQFNSRVVTIEEDVNEFKFNSNVINLVPLYGSRNGRITTRMQAINALRMRPEVLVIGEVRGDEARELFAAAGIGVQFLTTMHSSDAGIALLKKLMLKPLDVDQRSLAGLDLCIFMKQESPSKKVIERVSEYMWLSRAEADSRGQLLDSGDSVTVIDTVSESRLDRGVLQKSKVISKYSERTGCSKSQACKELDKRSAFISGLQSKNMSTLDIICEIRKY